MKDKIYQQAIDRGVWIKKGTTAWWTDHRPIRWCESRIEVGIKAIISGKVCSILKTYDFLISFSV